MRFDEIFKLRDFLNNLTVVDTPERTKIPIKTPPGSSNASPQIISDREFIELIKANIRSTDDFYKLLSVQKMELTITRLEEIIAGAYKNEVAIQHFLRDNIRMFGNDYVHIVENGKINAQNILDMVPQNFESYIDIIEVKLPEKNYSTLIIVINFYSTSHLTKAIAQTQNYIFELEKKTIDEGYQKENSCKVIRPKGIILFRSQALLGEKGADLSYGISWQERSVAL